MGWRAGVAAVAAVWIGLSAQAQAQPPPSPVTLSANPPRVCLDARPTSYLNFDIVIRNPTAKAVKVRELRAFVLNPKGEVVERRILWQDALSILGSHASVAAGEEAIVFNPFAFNSVKAGSRIRYEVDLEGARAPAPLTVAPVSCATKARLVAPITGRIQVFDGWDFLSHHRRTALMERAEARAFGIVDNWFRFGLDLLPTDVEGRLFRGEGRRNEDWYGWGAPVRAPGDGVVHALRDDQPDNDQPGSENRWVPKRLSQDEMDPDGNYLIIDHGGGEVSVLSHLKQGSIRVRKGERVRAGQAVAAVGSSGSSPVPHLHYDLRTGWGARGVRSMPAWFHGVTVVGTGEGRRGEAVAVNTGDVLVAR
jgi:hypothetical protein